jgi:hypothetical protein
MYRCSGSYLVHMGLDYLPTGILPIVNQTLAILNTPKTPGGSLCKVGTHLCAVGFHHLLWVIFSQLSWLNKTTFANTGMEGSLYI